MGMKILNNYLFFYQGIYSNWHHCVIIDPNTGLSFPNTEQAFMWYKANFFGDASIASKLRYPMHPKEAKKLGREVRNFSARAWDCVKFGFMVYVNYLKFSQNKEYGAELIKTDKLTLVEASPYDEIWGIKMSLNEDGHILSDKNNWMGQNLLGKALGSVREMIR
jgi:ribA/ribD-fused uncharacterized protein